MRIAVLDDYQDVALRMADWDSLAPAFVAGLLMSNSLITLGSVYGLWGARSNRVAYLAIGLATAVFSIVVGVLFLLSRSSILPPFLA